MYLSYFCAKDCDGKLLINEAPELRDKYQEVLNGLDLEQEKKLEYITKVANC